MHLHLWPPEQVSKLWLMTMDEYQHIERFYDYITNTCD